MLYRKFFFSPLRIQTPANRATTIVFSTQAELLSFRYRIAVQAGFPEARSWPPLPAPSPRSRLSPAACPQEGSSPQRTRSSCTSPSQCRGSHLGSSPTPSPATRQGVKQLDKKKHVAIHTVPQSTVKHIGVGSIPI